MKIFSEESTDFKYSEEFLIELSLKRFQLIEPKNKKFSS